jgi:hypothetical protein
VRLAGSIVVAAAWMLVLAQPMSSNYRLEQLALAVQQHAHTENRFGRGGLLQ